MNKLIETVGIIAIAVLITMVIIDNRDRWNEPEPDYQIETLQL